MRKGLRSNVSRLGQRLLSGVWDLEVDGNQGETPDRAWSAVIRKVGEL